MRSDLTHWWYQRSDNWSTYPKLYLPIFIYNLSQVLQGVYVISAVYLFTDQSQYLCKLFTLIDTYATHFKKSTSRPCK